MPRYGMLIDTTACIGCFACEQACGERWGNPESEIHKLSSTKNTAVQQYDEIFVPKLCMHCQEPTCASVCPVGALQKTAEGPVVYDADKCIGCRYCMQACPFDVPKYQWNSLNPKVTKCDLCHDRITKGEKPACVVACPAEARIFGELDELIKEATRRLQANPSTYEQHIYGVREAGGTSVLFLAAKPFEQLGMRTNLPDHPLPSLTWAVLSKIPNYVFWGSTMLAGIWWITNRRKEVQAYENALEAMELRKPSNGSQNHESKK
ncbi:MAG: 4Fe-4S dicluster domain-containing protein [Bacteroidota bacterium]